MEDYSSDKAIFNKLFEKKEKMLSYISQGKINAMVYKGMLAKKQSEIGKYFLYYIAPTFKVS